MLVFGTQNGKGGSLESGRNAVSQIARVSPSLGFCEKISKKNNKPMWALFWYHATYLIGLKHSLPQFPQLKKEPRSVVC